MADFTPGPWYVVGDPWGDSTEVVAGHPDPHFGRRVAITDLGPLMGEEELDDDIDRHRWDAQLIAEAPALLGVLKFFVFQARSWHEETGHDEVSAVQCDGICEAMVQAEKVLERVGEKGDSGRA